MKTKELSLLILLGISLVVLLMLSQQANENKIQEWASDNGYQVVNIEERYLNWGPFKYRKNDQKIYQVKVIDKQKRQRRIWFRIGHMFTDVEEE